jgi:uncharacterized protein Yka (UPF0111/DUF47 family)
VLTRQNGQLGAELAPGLLLLPDALGRALEASDRLRYCLALLAAAERRATAPGVDVPSLRAEREATGIDDPGLDGVVAGARREEGTFRFPCAERVHRLVVECLDDMVAPLIIDGAAPGGNANRIRERVQALLATLPPVEGDRVDPRYLDVVVRTDPGGADSLAALAGDLRRELACLQEQLSREAVDGAQVYGLGEEDRELVRAFMAGVRETSELLFGHPGHVVTATRSGEGLVLQCELAGAEPHVLVARVTGLACTVTHCDAQVPRARFFEALLGGFGIAWSEVHAREAPRREEHAARACAASHVARDRGDLQAFLTVLGSRLAFLADWNRARKRLRTFVDGPGAVEVLRWAADQHHGHRAFLQLGAERLVYEAVERAAPTPIRYGQRLDEVLGRAQVIAFLEAVLRITCDALRQGRSERFVRDEIRAELAGRFETVEHGVLSIAAQHATCVGRIAAAVREALAAGAGSSVVARAAADASMWERDADELVDRGRRLSLGSRETAPYARLLAGADDAADALEDAAFLLTVLPPGTAAAAGAPFDLLAALLVAAADEWERCVAAALAARADRAREGLQGFLASVDRVAELEDRADGAQRALVAALYSGPADARALQLLLLVAQAMEHGADALAHAALALRDHLLAEGAPR